MPTRPVLLARDGIKKLIAHREPMLFVDRVIEHATGARLVAEADGVPADPLQILEAMGQASALLIRQTPAYSCRDLPVFAGMDDVRWEDTPPTGGCIRYDVQFSATKRSRARFGFVDAAAVVGGERICTARLFFSFFDK